MKINCINNGTKKNDIAKKWQSVNEIISKKKLKNEVTNTLTNEDDCTISDEQEISNMMNDYFTNIGKNMDASIPKSGIKKVFIPSLVNAFCYEHITADEVLLQSFT